MSNKNQTPINSPFGHFTKASEVIKGIDLTGKNAIVTGSYTGIGLHTTKALTSAGARVIVLARDVKRAKKICVVSKMPRLNISICSYLKPLTKRRKKS
jgi:hypothetical protein